MSQMTMSLNINMASTSLPNSFIDTYMLDANPTYSLIFIYAYRCCCHGENNLDNLTMAEKFNILESDVLNAFKYWENKGLIKLAKEQDSNYSLKFLDFYPYNCGKNQQDNVVDFKQARLSAIDKGDDSPLKDESIISPIPYEPEELALYASSSKDIKDIFEMASKVMGKMLRHEDMLIIFSFHDKQCMNLPIDVIKRLFNYCMEIKQTKISYLKTVAMDWADNCIYTVKKADDYINTFYKVHRKILKAFGITDRMLGDKEIKFMKKWINEYNLSLELILKACDKTLMNVGKVNFNYTDTVLEDWFKSGVKTLEDVKIKEELYKIDKKEQKESLKSNNTSKKNRFINFIQRNQDYAELERLEEEYIEESLKG